MCRLRNCLRKAGISANGKARKESDVLCNSDGVPGEVGSLKETSLAVWRDAGVVGQKRANVFMPCQSQR
jgi:hypothetical protein